MFHSIDFIASSPDFSAYPITESSPVTFENYLSLAHATKWKKNKYYPVGESVIYSGKKYICKTAHTSGSSFSTSKFVLFDRPYEDKGFWNTWEDWHLIPSSRPSFKPPKKKKRIVDIPGTDSYLDLSDDFQNGPIYENSEGSWEFYIDNDWEPWEVIYSKIMNVFHGKKLCAILEDDQGFFRFGTFSVNDLKSEPQNSKIVLDYSVYPYKIAVTASDEDCYWDPILFETDVIRDYKNVVISDGNVVYTRNYVTASPHIIDEDSPQSATFIRPSLDFYAGEKKEVATIACLTSDSLEITIKKVSKNIYGVETLTPVVSSRSLSAGSIYSIALTEKLYRITFSGSGTLIIKYREGSL